MMRMRTKLTGLSPTNENTVNSGGGRGGGGGDGVERGSENLEVRPCGMLVQKRLDADQTIKPPPTIRVRVKYGSIYHDIYINSQASFGELKKMLTRPTGLHHEDQKLYFKKKERDSKEFLDIVGVKDNSKLVLMEDPISQEKRFLEMRKNAKMEKAAKFLSEIGLQVDKLAGQVADIESLILKGGRVEEKEIVSVIELLMNEVVKLDGIVAVGDVKLQRNLQVKRVQKYVETLDMLKIKNSMPKANVGNMASQNQQRVPNGHQTHEEKASNGVKFPPVPSQRGQRHSIGHSPLRPQPEHQPSKQSTPGIVVSTQWETFESVPPLIPISPRSSSGSATAHPTNPKFPWEF